MVYCLLKQGSTNHRHRRKQSSGRLTKGARLVGPLAGTHTPHRAEGTSTGAGKALALAACRVPQGAIPTTRVGIFPGGHPVVMSTPGPERNKTLGLPVGRYLLES